MLHGVIHNVPQCGTVHVGSNKLQKGKYWMYISLRSLVRDLCVFVDKSLLFFLKKREVRFKNLIVVAPHPDDEILGVGGILLQNIERGAKVQIVYLTDGEGSGVWHDQEEIKRQRTLLSGRVRGKLGLKSSGVTRFHLPDGQVPFSGQPGFSEAVRKISLLIEELKPEAVFATHPLDHWPYDHVACGEMAREAVRQSSHKPQLWYYWVWAWYNIRPWKLFQLRKRNIYKVDIFKQLAEKKKLTGIYLNAKNPDGKPWSGVLPKALVRAAGEKWEVVERII